MNGIKVAKFGGTSLADAGQIRKVIDIIRADKTKRFIVVSAPGKRSSSDVKITDLLYGIQHAAGGKPMEQLFKTIEARFLAIIHELRLKFDPAPHFDAIRQNALNTKAADFLISRGEYIMGNILAEALGYTFVDATQIIQFDFSGTFDKEATQQRSAVLEQQANGFVIPGFYGSLPDGSVKTFTRGGSDLSGAIIASLTGADVYENWTDVSGLLRADPRIVSAAKPIETVTYKELRELTYMGACVLHEEVIFPLRDAGIPIHLRNTNRPADRGTLIVPDATPQKKRAGSIVGIAGRKDFTVITVEKSLMNQEVGFIRRICSVFEKNAVSVEHIPGGIDTLSVVVTSESLNGKVHDVLSGIKEWCKPDTVNISPGMALICTVGHAMTRRPGVASRLFSAVAAANVNIRMIDQGSSELSIIIGVENADYETAIRAIYDAFK